MTIRKYARGLAALFALFAAAPAWADDIRIAVAGPMRAIPGADMKAGALAARDVINANGGIGGKHLELVFEDDNCSPKEAVSVANRIVAAHITMLYGHFCSPTTLAAMDVYRENPVAQLTISQADQVTRRRHAGLFRINVGNDQLSAALGPIMNDAKGPQAILHDQGAFGQSILDAVLPQLKAKPFLGTFTDDDRDFSAIAVRLKSAGIQTVLIAGQADKIGMIIRQLRQNGFTGRFLAPGTGTLPDVAQIAGCLTEGVQAVGVDVDHKVYDSRPDIQAAFAARNVPPRDTVLLSYAAIEALAAARARAGSDQPGAIADALATGGINTLIGNISWDIHGNLKGNHVRLNTWTCQNGVPVLKPTR